MSQDGNNQTSTGETSGMNRRNFTRLFAAALGGIAAGTLVGCGGKKDGDKKDGKTAPTGGQGSGTSQGGSADNVLKATADVDPSLLVSGDKNVCRGLNTCKGKGKGDHSCAGQGACATVDTHVCQGMNDCKGHGGCGEHPGQNTCKGKGACAVPLTSKTWAKARAKFEQVASVKGMKVGPAPAK